MACSYYLQSKLPPSSYLEVTELLELPSLLLGHLAALADEGALASRGEAGVVGGVLEHQVPLGLQNISRGRKVLYILLISSTTTNTFLSM